MGRRSLQTIPIPGLSGDFIGGLYNPEFVPEDLDLNDFVEEVEVHTEEVRQVVNNKGSQLITEQLPITEEEAQEAAQQIKNNLLYIEETRKRVVATRAKIDDLIKSSRSGTKAQGQELSFKIDISKKPRIRRAIQKLFGYKTDTITYSMYKELLMAKNNLEQDEAHAYVSGTPV